MQTDDYKSQLKKQDKYFKSLREFLATFPKDKIESMDIDEYVTGKKNQKAFCYWLEETLEFYGSISGRTTAYETVTINGKKKYFYSFASKYCSHHNQVEFPIYDSYVDIVLRYFRKADKFYNFKNEDLKDYCKFKNILLKFREYYGLQEFSLKELDKYLWQFGKFYFPKKY